MVFVLDNGFLKAFAVHLEMEIENNCREFQKVIE